MPIRAFIDRLRALGAERLNLAVAVLFAVEMQIEAAFRPVDGIERPYLHALLLSLAAAVAVRRRLPLTSLVVSQVVFVATQHLSKEVADNLYLPLFVILLLSVSAAMNTDGRRFWCVPLITFTGGSVMTLTDHYANDASDILWIGIIYSGLTAAVGRLLRNRSRLHAALREKTARLERERVVRAEQAAVEERTRIAGELHDIIAHALSGMVIQSSAARRLVDRDPEKARDAFAAVEASGRDALAELRRLLGVLRREDEELALAPTPSLAHVESLARRARAAGLPVDLHVEGTPVALAAGIDLTAYRVLQDALSEALTEGRAGHADVLVRYGDDAIELEVRDDGHLRDETGGRRLLGMRERVTLVGGELHTDRARDGGHALRARLPIEVAA